MVQTTEAPGEPAEFLDDSKEDYGSGEGEGNEGAGSGEGGEEEEDESDERGEDMMEIEDHRHLQVEGFDMALLLADNDDGRFTHSLLIVFSEDAFPSCFIFLFSLFNTSLIPTF